MRSADKIEDVAEEATDVKEAKSTDDKSKAASKPDPLLQRQVVNMSNEPNGAPVSRVTAEPSGMAPQWPRPSDYTQRRYPAMMPFAQPYPAIRAWSV